MNVFTTDKIRNVVLLGHGGCGKTSLVEAIAYLAGFTNRMGTVENGNTISDYDKEEIKRKISLKTTVVPVPWEEYKINLLDTPGYPDFVGEVEEAVSAADAAIIVVSGKTGIEEGTVRAWEACEKKKLPRMVFVTGMDDDKASFREVVQKLQEMYGKRIAPFHLPIRENEQFVGYVNVIQQKAKRWNDKGTVDKFDVPDYSYENLNICRDALVEAVAETSEEFMERFFEGDTFSEDEIRSALRVGVCDGSVVPVLMGSNTMARGMYTLMADIIKYFPSPEQCTVAGINTTNNEVFNADYDFAKAKSAYIFKTIADPFAGHISIFKVVTGHVEAGMKLVNMRNGREEDFSKIYIMTGKKMEETGVLYAGDIGAVMKLDDTHTNDVLSVSGYQYVDEPIKFPQPYYGKALKPIGKANEDKISAALNRFLEEDPTLRFETNAETAEQCLYGLGDIHLTTVVDRLKDKYNVEVKLSDITLCFRETIRNEVTHRTKYKKQTGGHGQYGDVEIKFEPTHDYDTPYVFAEEVFGGAVPKSYFPAVEKGLAEAVQHGVLAGYPVLGIKATLLDGSYHPVDSSEQAFKTATLMCFKSALPKANPILLEPYVTINAVCEESYLGDIMSYFNKHRSRVIGQEILDDGLMKITAEAPQAEVMNFAIDLKSMTQGSGYFTETFLDYEYMDKYLQERVIEARKDKVE